MMPSSELVSVVVKAQHNCWSDNRQYSGNFVPIQHEYLLLWKRAEQTIFQVAYDKVTEIQKQAAATWRSVIRIALMKHGGKATLDNIYSAVEKIAGELIAKNQHWKAKVRQVLQKHFDSVQRGIWAVA
jgi:arylamine N-acetyltransferase